MASFRRRQMGALCCLGIEAQPEKLSRKVVARLAGERRLREHGAALAHHVDVAVADEIGGNEPVDLKRRDVARPAGEIDDGIGPLVRRARRVFRDQELDGSALRAAAIFPHDEIAAARFGQLLGPRQFRARGLLEARHRPRFLGLGKRAWYRQEKSKKESDAGTITHRLSLPCG